jgi:hypothetical protein
MKKKTKAEKQLDSAIEQEYYKRAQGRQIGVMKIGPLFQYVRDEAAKGVELGLATQAAIEKFCDLSEVL